VNPKSQPKEGEAYADTESDRAKDLKKSQVRGPARRVLGYTRGRVQPEKAWDGAGRSREKKMKGPKAQRRIKRVKGPKARRDRRSS